MIEELLVRGAWMFVVALVAVLGVASVWATWLERREQRRQELEVLRTLGIAPARRRWVWRRDPRLRPGGGDR